jgi:hypothetical protein
MAPLTYMKKSSTPPGLEPSHALHDRAIGIPDLDLELPIDPDFVSRPPRLTLEQAIPVLEQYRQWFPPRPGEAERRLQGKCAVEFVL